MQVLPLKFIHDTDKKNVGLNLFNLAKLNRLGIPVIESVVVTPPFESIKKIIDKYSRHKSVNDNLANFKREFLNLKMPEALAEIHISYSVDKNKIAVSLDKLWRDLLDKWLSELISKIERQEKNLLNLTPQQVIFASNFSSLGSAFFDEINGRVEILSDKGKPDFKVSEQIENLVLLCNRKLILPQIYYWASDKSQVKIIKVAPFTQVTERKEENKISQTENPSKKILKKTATKIILSCTDETLVNIDTDYVLMNISNTNVEKVHDMISKIDRFGEKKIIFFPKFDNSEQNISEYAKLFIFFKNKKNLNCQIVLPPTFSVEEFLNLKRQFASLGIYNKGNLKIWKQFLNIADFINTDEYLEAGFDGAVLDLDRLVKLITGIDSSLFLSEPRLDWINSIEKFFKENGFSKLIKGKKLVLITGEAARSEELLQYFIKSGIWGIGCRSNVLDSLTEHVSFLEKNHIKKSGT